MKKNAKLNSRSNKQLKNINLSQKIFGELIGNFSKNSLNNITKKDIRDDILAKKCLENKIVKNLEKNKLLQKEEFRKMGLNSYFKKEKKIIKRLKKKINKTEVKEKLNKNNKINKKYRKIKNLSINENLNKIIKTHKEKIVSSNRNNKHKEKTNCKDFLLKKKVNNIKNKKNNLTYIYSQKSKLFLNKINSFNNNFKLNNNKELLDNTINTKDEKVKKFGGKYNFNNLNKIITFLNNDIGLLTKRNKIRNNLKQFKKNTTKDPKKEDINSFLEENIDKKDSLENYEFKKFLGDGCLSKVYLYERKKNKEKFALKFFEKKNWFNNDKFLYLKVN